MEGVLHTGGRQRCCIEPPYENGSGADLALLLCLQCPSLNIPAALRTATLVFMLPAFRLALLLSASMHRLTRISAD